jgi:putative Mg2+ transporter-C (MgtC) family protein
MTTFVVSLSLLHTLYFIGRAAIAVALGALVGFERQWRQRMAGLRTNALVALGAALFELFAILIAGQRGADPTRIAAYVVSGVGFLGAGVILRDGVNVRGINTAATIWCSAAVGVLAGGGYVIEAVAAAVLVLSINILLRSLGRRIDRQPVDHDTEIETTYRFRATTRDNSEAHVRALLLQAISGHGYHLRALESADIDGTDLVEVRAELATLGRDDDQIEAAAGRLGLEPDVTAVRWQVVGADTLDP